MDDERYAQLEKALNEHSQLVRKLGIQHQLLRDIVLFLCATTVPRAELTAYLERIQVPVDWGSSENLEIMEREISALFGDLSTRFGVRQP